MDSNDNFCRHDHLKFIHVIHKQLWLTVFLRGLAHNSFVYLGNEYQYTCKKESNSLYEY